MSDHLKAIVGSIWQPFLLWAIAVLGISFGARQPGVACMTPVAWSLALWVGLLYSARTSGPTKSSRLGGAALAGAIFGLLQGVLFVVVMSSMGELKPGEEQKALGLNVFMVVAGAVVCALLSLATAASQEKRRAKTN